MGRYVIAVGGTGSKVLEAVVYAACADAFSAADGAPLPVLDLLSVDVDASCGNTTRAKRAAEAYEEARASFGPASPSHPCFHTRLRMERWSMNLSLRASSVREMTRNHEADRLLARTLFTPAEAALEYSEGFRGHPDLGVLFFSGLLGGLEEARAQGLPDEFNAMTDRMRSDLDRGETVQVLLAGSIFGGTGASGIPALSKYLRRRFAGDTERFVMGSVLLLPYYHVPLPGADAGSGITVSSGEFLDKARTALQYYGMAGMVRNGPEDAEGIFDAVYLLGLSPEHFGTARLYATGSQRQQNDAHMLEWLAARCVARFFATGFRGADSHNIDCYYYQCHTPRFGWDSFDSDGALYRARYGALLKAGAVFVTECYPTLAAYLRQGCRSLGRVSYCAAFFHRAAHAPLSARERLGRRLDALYGFFAFYLNWVYQVVLTLPPALRGADGAPDGLPENALAHAATLEALHAFLASQGRDEAACRQAQQGLARLVSGPAADRRDMARVISGLGAGARTDSPDDALAAFLSVLLTAVMEDG